MSRRAAATPLDHTIDRFDTAVGPEDLPPHLTRRAWRRRCRSAHRPRTRGYGLTETSEIVNANYGPTCLLKPASCGPIVPTLEARLVDDRGAVLKRSPDAIGRLEVRGAVVFAGYLNRPDATSEVIRDGWLDTGDVVRIDEDGFVYIVDGPRTS